MADANGSQHGGFGVEEGFLVEDEVIRVIGGDPPSLQAKLDGLYKEVVIVFHAGETLFFSGSYQRSVADQCGGSVVIVT